MPWKRSTPGEVAWNLADQSYGAYVCMPEVDNPELFRAVLGSLSLAVSVLDRNGRITFWNQEAAHSTGYMEPEVIGRSYEDALLCHQDDRGIDQRSQVSPFMSILHAAKSAILKTHLRHKRGYSFPVLINITPIRDENGAWIATAVSFDPHISRSGPMHVGRNLPPVAALDASTGVANHSFTLFHLRESLAAFAELHIPFGILRVKPDELEHFRAAYGREASDAIVSVIAQMLGNSFRPGDFVGRWAADEFLVILKSCTRAGVRSVYERIRSTIGAAEIRWWGELLSVPLSLGYTSVEVDDSIDSLLQRGECPPRAAMHTPSAAGGSASPRS
ncbi:MAG: diguanylate cyclase [Acidobacteriaceae bacterium]|nr:diguanylate cyclase [Acidobacteriaceae bacterium]